MKFATQRVQPLTHVFIHTARERQSLAQHTEAQRRALAPPVCQCGGSEGPPEVNKVCPLSPTAPSSAPPFPCS